LKRIDAVTAEDILELANEYLKEEELTRVFVRSPKKQLKKVA
jgi:predicted Zn-dependent peptidase